MSGLVMKDLCVLRRVAKTYLAIIVIYAALSMTGMWSADFFAGIMTVLVAMLPINVFSWDNAARWDGYCMALPVRRSRVVAARYVVALLALAEAAVLSLAMGGVLMALGQVADWEQYAISVGGTALGGCLLNALTMPILYKVGPERGRVAVFAVFGGTAVVVFLAAKAGAFDGLDALPQPSVAAILGVMVLIGAALLTVSYLVSCWIYQRKEV